MTGRAGGSDEWRGVFQASQLLVYSCHSDTRRMGVSESYTYGHALGAH